MVARRASGNKINNIIVVRIFIIFCVIKHHAGSPITIDNLFGQSDKSYMLLFATTRSVIMSVKVPVVEVAKCMN